jgi:hypothetical protein
MAPAFATVAPGASVQLDATAMDAAGLPVPDAAVDGQSLDAARATVEAGAVTGVSAGAARISARSGHAAETAIVAVLGAGDLLSTAFASGSIRAAARHGDTVEVIVRLDMSRASSNGDLGALQFELSYDPAILTFEGTVPGAAGLASSNVPVPGTFRFAFVATAPQGNANLILVTVRFQVIAGAPARTTSFGLVYPVAPMSTGSYRLPAAGCRGGAGRVRIEP